MPILQVLNTVVHVTALSYSKRLKLENSNSKQSCQMRKKMVKGRFMCLNQFPKRKIRFFIFYSTRL